MGGNGGEGAKFWMSVLTDLRNRGVKDVFFVVCDGLKGLPEVVAKRVAANYRASGAGLALTENAIAGVRCGSSGAEL